MTDQTSTTVQTSDDLAEEALATSQTTNAQSSDVGVALMSLQNIIERNADELDQVHEKLKEHRDSLHNIFENDQELSQAEEEVTSLTNRVKQRKTAIQTSPEAVKLKTLIGDLTEQKKEIEEALSNHLLNLYKLTGTATFDTSSGEQREFKVRASLMAKKKAA